MDTLDLSGITKPADTSNMAYVDFMVIASAQTVIDAVPELDGMLDLMPPASPARSLLVGLIGALMRNHEVAALGRVLEGDAAVAAAAAAEAERERLGTAKPIMSAVVPGDTPEGSDGAEIDAGVGADEPGVAAVAVRQPAPVAPVDREAFAPAPRGSLHRGRGRR